MGVGNAFSNPTTTPLAKIDVRPSIVDEKGLYGADLSTGTYLYTLVADGVNVASKKMVKQ